MLLEKQHSQIHRWPDTTESHSADMSRSSRHLRRVMILPGKKEKSRPCQPQTKLKSKLDAYYVPGVKR